MFGLMTLSVSTALAYSLSVLPTSSGTYSSWSPSTGTVHYTLVDESSCNGTGDYVSTTAAGNRDSYAVSLASIPDGSVITSIAISPCASRNSNKTSVMNVFYRLNGVNSADQGSYSLSGTTPTPLAATNYSGLSFVKAPSTSLEIGVVLTSGTGGARLSQISTTITYTPPVPAAPTNLNASIIGTSTSIGLSWTDNSSIESGFMIERSTDNVTFTILASTTANVTSYTDSATSIGNTYYYRVRAYNAGGNSANSNVASVVIAAPLNPSSLVVNVITNATTSTSYAFMTWTDNSSNETNFIVEKSTDNVTFAQASSLSANSTSYADFSVSSGATYYYRVKATNTFGSSGYSNVSSITIP